MHICIYNIYTMHRVTCIILSIIIQFKLKTILITWSNSVHYITSCLMRYCFETLINVFLFELYITWFCLLPSDIYDLIA